MVFSAAKARWRSVRSSIEISSFVDPTRCAADVPSTCATRACWAMPGHPAVAPALQKYKELLLKLKGSRFVDERACATLAAVGGASRFFMLHLNNTHVQGAEHLNQALLHRKQGQALITVSNHVAAMDDPLVSAAIVPPEVIFDRDQLRWTLCATDRCFKSPMVSSFFRTVKVLPVERGAGLEQAGMQVAYSRIQRGDWVHIFPEGTRSKDGSIGKTVKVVVGEPIPVDDLLRSHSLGMTTAEELFEGVASRVEFAMCTLRARLEDRPSDLPVAEATPAARTHLRRYEHEPQTIRRSYSTSRANPSPYSSSGVQRTQAAPPPTSAQGQAPGLLGSIAGMVGQGMAWGTGSAIANRAVDSVAGPRQIEHVHSQPEAAPAQASYAGETCANQQKAFLDCMEANSGEMSRCQYYFDVMQQCKAGFN
eukprot:jgi/Pico_ML_1/53554/g4084.t1